MIIEKLFAFLNALLKKKSANVFLTFLFLSNSMQMNTSIANN